MNNTSYKKVTKSNCDAFKVLILLDIQVAYLLHDNC